MSEKIGVGGIGFHPVTMKSLMEEIQTAVNENRRGNMICTLNTDIFMMSLSDPELRAIIDRCWRVVADGMPLVWVSRLGPHPLPERVTGSDLTRELCLQGPNRGFRLFFMGAGPGVADEAKRKMELQAPGLIVSGTYCPTPGELADVIDSRKLVKEINSSGANILLVALGAPKQEKWIARHLSELEVSVVIGVGASLDFLAGTVTRAPVWMQRIGLEWAYRLSREPRRLWKRYLRDFFFIKVVLRELANAVNRNDNGNSYGG